MSSNTTYTCDICHVEGTLHEVPGTVRLDIHSAMIPDGLIYKELNVCKNCMKEFQDFIKVLMNPKKDYQEEPKIDQGTC